MMKNSTIVITTAALKMADEMNSTMEANTTQMPQTTTIEQFSDSYNKYVHGYLCLFVCMFGILSNGLSLVVLTRPRLRSPTNMILATIASVDLVGCAITVLVSLKFFIVDNMYLPQCYSRGWMDLSALNYYFYHTWVLSNIWLTLSLAVVRFIIVYRSSVGNFINVILIKHAVCLVAGVLIFSCVFVIPLMVMVPVMEYPENSTCYNFDYDPMTVRGWEIAFEVFSVIPCIFLIVCSVLLILQIRRVKRRRLSLKQSQSAGGKKTSFRWKDENRTTYMLLAVVFFSVVTKMPWLMLVIINHFSEYFKDVYQALSNLFYLLDFLNSSVNIVIYYRMSHHFRDGFSDMFLPSRWKSDRRSSDVSRSTSFAENSM